MNTKRSLMMTVGLAATMVAFGLTFKAAAGGVKNVTTNTSYALEESVFNRRRARRLISQAMFTSSRTQGSSPTARSRFPSSAT